MKTAIVYYSLEGNTEYVADKIKSFTGADTLRLVPKKAYHDKGFAKFFWGGKSAVMAETPELMPYTFDPDRYDQLVIGFPVWAFNVAPPVRTFVAENKEAVRNLKIAAFACQGGSGAEKAFKKLLDCLGQDSFSATMVLNDPMSKAEIDQAIAAFTAKLA